MEFLQHDELRSEGCGLAHVGGDLLTIGGEVAALALLYDGNFHRLGVCKWLVVQK
jgi:hypothetical protein